MSLDLKESIENTLKTFDRSSLREAGIDLFRSLGYESKKTLRLKDNTLAGFTKQFSGAKKLNHDRAMSANWKTIDVLFQLTDDEVRQGLGFGQEDMFTSDGQVDDTRIESYLFVAIELKAKDDGTNYTRTDLSRITRALNHQDVFRVPILLLFRHEGCLSLAVINRRLHKRDASRDVLEKVTLIKDITYADPLRAHIEILHDLALPKLYDEYKFTGFVGLHQAWEKRLASYALNERFYREIADWYFDALQNPKVVMPRTIAEMSDDVEREKARSLFFIRLLTRLIFCWFLQEKGLVPRDLFRERRMKELLKDASPSAGTYYRAFLQNLFFATLNQEQDKRDWREKAEGNARFDKNVGITHLWRFKDDLRDPAALEALLRERVPFVNGGLFDCLDDQLAEPKVFLDGFSERKTNTLHVPNALFFGKERTVDLSDVLHDKRRSREKVSGLINILSRYKFTIEENTPLEEEIALDPELLGKVFENLLASFNEDTQTTARKALGAFYTPRAVVSYMVDEALCSYLGSKVSSVDHDQLTTLMKAHPDEYEAADHFTPEEIKALVAAIGSVRIIDHAAGSGAYPMGALQRLVDLLQKLDPNNESWKRDRLEEARRYYESLRMANASDEELRQVEDRIADIEKSFDTHYHELDYARKLFLIENSIYGVDIQPVACQIAKLRFFIAMIVDQKVKREARNLGVRPMPNLETKIVAANALISYDIPQLDLFSENAVEEKRKDLLKIRHDHFDARTPAKKRKLREADKKLRHEIAEILKENDFPVDEAEALADWDPYDQNGSAAFFTPSWMFGFKKDDALFDIVVANPPYVRQEKIKHLKPALKDHFRTFVGTADLYVYFYERALQLLRPGGAFSFITSNKWYRSAYGEKLRATLANETTLHHVIDFGDAEVFTAIAYPTIVVGQKTPAKKDHIFRSLVWDPKTDKAEIDHFARFYAEHAVDSHQKDLMPDPHPAKPKAWQFIDSGSRKVLDRIRKAGVPLGAFVHNRFYYGIKTGLNEAFVVDRATRDRLIAEDPKCEAILKPFLRGRDVKRWRIEYQNLWLILIESSENKTHAWSGKEEAQAEKVFAKTYPSVYRFFHEGDIRERLIKRYDQGKYFWELRSCAYYEDFGRPKVVYPDIYEHQSFAYDDTGAFLANTCYFMPHETDARILTGLLNSAVVEWFYGQISNRIRGGYLRAFTDYMKQVPIAKMEKSQKRHIELLGSAAATVSRWLEDRRSSGYGDGAGYGDGSGDGSGAGYGYGTGSGAGFSDGSGYGMGGPYEPTPRDTLMLGYFEQILNALVYELYFPEDLHKKGLKIFDLVEKAELPDIETLPEPKRLPTLRDTFERLYDLKHPLRGALQTLRSLDVVRIIEGDEGR